MATDARKVKDAAARLTAAHEKVESVAKMATHAEKMQTAAMLRAYRAGVTQAAIARTMGVTSGRVWQMLRDAGAFTEATEEAPAERVRPLRARPVAEAASS